MDLCASAAWLSSVAEPLSVKFGDGLTLARDGDSVHWSFAGQTAVVDFLPTGNLRATFIDCNSVDIVSKQTAAAAYRTHTSYGLNRVSCSRMIADMVDFFSGVREPKFVFFQAYLR